MFAFILALMALYLGATELIKGKKSKGEVIVFPRTKMPKNGVADLEGGGKGVSVAQKEKEKDEVSIQRQTAIFHWQDVCYDVQIKKETRRILDHVDGWVKPGTLTALMVSRSDGRGTAANESDNRLRRVFLELVKRPSSTYSPPVSQWESYPATSWSTVNSETRVSSARPVTACNKTYISPLHLFEKPSSFLLCFVNPVTFPSRKSWPTLMRCSSCLTWKLTNTPSSEISEKVSGEVGSCDQALD